VSKERTFFKGGFNSSVSFAHWEEFSLGFIPKYFQGKKREKEKERVKLQLMKSRKKKCKEQKKERRKI
jgi:hypothetical protein